MDFTGILKKWLAPGPAAEANAAIVAELGRAIGKLLEIELAGMVAKAGPAPAAKPVQARKVARKKLVRDMGCISPGCKEQSRGPRWSYLCRKHEGASTAQVESWRKLRASKKAG